MIEHYIQIIRPVGLYSNITKSLWVASHSDEHPRHYGVSVPGWNFVDAAGFSGTFRMMDELRTHIMFPTWSQDKG